MKEFRDRRIMLLMRAALFFAGGMIGAVAMWQTMDVIHLAFPIVIQVMCYIAAILFFGGVLSLSAPPLRAGFHAFSMAVRKKFRSVKAVDIAGIVVGLLAGLSVAVSVELLLALVLKIVAIRIVIDAGLGLLAAFLTAVAVSGFVTPAELTQHEEPIVSLRPTKGYLVTEAALGDPKIVALCARWLDGNIYVLSRTADALATSGEDEETGAFTNFKALYNSRKVRILEFLTDDVLDAAEQKKLKIIAIKTETKIIENKRGITVLPLSIL